MGSFKKFIVPFLILFIFLTLVFNFRSFLLTNIVEPIALLSWAAWRIVSSVDQNIYWIFLIVFCSILIIFLGLSRNDISPKSAFNDIYLSLNRVEHWQALIKDAALGKKESECLRDGMKKLLMTVIAQTSRSNSTEIEESIANEEVSLPLGAHRRLFPPRGKHEMFSRSHQLNIIPLVPIWLRKWAGKFIHQDNTWIDEILRWMETELEIHYEK